MLECAPAHLHAYAHCRSAAGTRRINRGTGLTSSSGGDRGGWRVSCACHRQWASGEKCQKDAVIPQEQRDAKWETLSGRRRSDEEPQLEIEAASSESLSLWSILSAYQGTLIANADHSRTVAFVGLPYHHHPRRRASSSLLATTPPWALGIGHGLRALVLASRVELLAYPCQAFIRGPARPHHQLLRPGSKNRAAPASQRVGLRPYRTKYSTVQ